MFRRLIANFLIVTVSVYIAFLLIDLCIYIFISPKSEPHPRGMYNADKTRNYALAPGFVGIYNKPKPFLVEINDNGYRDFEWQFDDKFKVLVAGDSYTFGIGLPVEEGFVNKANIKMNNGIHFYNIGVPGYGVPHILETIKKECRGIKPNHIFYMYYFNDTRWDNMMIGSMGLYDGYLVYKYINNGKTILNDEDIRYKVEKELYGINKWSLMKTIILQNIRYYFAQKGIHPRLIFESLDKFKKRLEQTANPAYSIENTEKASVLIMEMANEAERCGSGFTMFILPGYEEAYYGIKETATERLLRKLEGKGILIVDLREYAELGVKLTLFGDGHYNTFATDWVSDNMIRHLQSIYPEIVK